MTHLSRKPPLRSQLAILREQGQLGSLVRAWHRTFELPVLISNCSNNYGPYQFPEKLIPHMILSALQGKALPIYGDDRQIRDWLYVEDHAHALIEVAIRGRIGEIYNIGGHNERRNLQVVETLCSFSLSRRRTNVPADQQLSRLDHVRQGSARA